MPATVDLPPEIEQKELEFYVKLSTRDSQTQGVFSIDVNNINWPNKDPEEIYQQERNTNLVLSSLEKFDNDIQDHLEFMPTSIRTNFNTIVDSISKLNPQGFNFEFTDQVSIDFQFRVGDDNIYIDYYLPIESEQEVPENSV